MKKSGKNGQQGKRAEVKTTRIHTLVIGSGAAGLNAAVQLRRKGVDVLIVTEGLKKGTSYNTGSDKQTYYKLSLGGAETDSVKDMAEALYAAGAMHGDLALTEAAVSARAFLNLVNLGVPYPQDAYGQFPGYKTDHDPARRATSTGPHMSRDMCVALTKEARRLRIPVVENLSVTDLLVSGSAGQRRVCGALALDRQGHWHAFNAANVVFATGGFGGLFECSVYPAGHLGAVGVALRAGAAAHNLPESQFGLASLKPRWNVSGSFMQVLPRVYSTAADGVSDLKDFMAEAYPSASAAYSMLFLKGYQWPFDSRKAADGSSRIDLLVRQETVAKGRRVFLDYRHDAPGLDLRVLSDEAQNYLKASGATQKNPLARLKRLNPDAYRLYLEFGLDLSCQPLEIAVCAQHNNGGLAANHWWESINLRHLFPVGEVNGTHGVGRPGGSALNSGQVGGIRAAEYIAAVYGTACHDDHGFEDALAATLADNLRFVGKCLSAPVAWQACRAEFQHRMSRAGAEVRSAAELGKAKAAALGQLRALEAEGCSFRSPGEEARVFETRQLCFAHAVYLAAQAQAVRGGVGSRGSCLVLDRNGNAMPEDPAFRALVQQSTARTDGTVKNRWIKRRPIPSADFWFETAWRDFTRNAIYRHKPPQ